MKEPPTEKGMNRLMWASWKAGVGTSYSIVNGGVLRATGSDVRETIIENRARCKNHEHDTGGGVIYRVAALHYSIINTQLTRLVQLLTIDTTSSLRSPPSRRNVHFIADSSNTPFSEKARKISLTTATSQFLY